MISVIIVEPEGDQNLGMIARGMANMGQSRLTLINPRCDHLSRGARQYAIHALPLLEKAQIFPDLGSALNNLDLAIAITRREGEKRRLDLESPALPGFLNAYTDRNIALVFGREQTGLTNEEVFLCNLSCSIPSHDSFPSLNLAQAVMIILYELYSANTTDSQSTISPSSPEEFDAMIYAIGKCLDTMDYFKKTDPSGLTYVLQKIFHRARLDSKDTVVIRNLFQRMEGKYISQKSKD